MNACYFSETIFIFKCYKCIFVKYPEIGSTFLYILVVNKTRSKYGKWNKNDMKIQSGID